MERSRVTVEYSHLPGQVFEHEANGVYCVTRSIGGRTPDDVTLGQVLEALEHALEIWGLEGGVHAGFPPAVTDHEDEFRLVTPSYVDFDVWPATLFCSNQRCGHVLRVARIRDLPQEAAMRRVQDREVPAAAVLPGPRVRRPARAADSCVRGSSARPGRVRGLGIVLHCRIPMLDLPSTPEGRVPLLRVQAGMARRRRPERALTYAGDGPRYARVLRPPPDHGVSRRSRADRRDALSRRVCTTRSATTPGRSPSSRAWRTRPADGAAPPMSAGAEALRLLREQYPDMPRASAG